MPGLAQWRAGHGELALALCGAMARGLAFGCLYYPALAMGSGCPLVMAGLRFFNAIRDTPWGRHCLWVEDNRIKPAGRPAP